MVALILYHRSLYRGNLGSNHLADCLCILFRPRCLVYRCCIKIARRQLRILVLMNSIRVVVAAWLKSSPTSRNGIRVDEWCFCACVCACVYIGLRACMYVRVLVVASVDACACLFVCACVCAYVCVHGCICVYMYVSLCVYVYVYACVCDCVCMRASSLHTAVEHISV